MAVRHNLAANYLGQGWSALMSLAFIPLYIKYLGMETYGLIGLFGVLQAWLSLLDAGMTPTLNREMARFTGGNQSVTAIRDLLRSFETLAIGIATTGWLCIFSASDWLASDWLRSEKLPIETVAHAISIMGLVTGLRFLEGVYRSALVGLQRQVLFNVINSATATVRGSGAVLILASVSPTVEAFFLWQAVVSVGSLAILITTTYNTLPRGTRSGQFSIAALLGVWRFAGGMLSINLLALLLTQVDKMMLSRIVPLSTFGDYTLAGTVAGALQLFIGPITQAFYPRFCELQVRGEMIGFADTYHRAAQLVSVTAGSQAIVLILFAETFLLLWTQNSELSTRISPLLRLLVLGNLLSGLMWIPYQAQLAHGWTGLTVVTNIIAVSLIVPAILLAVPHYGVIGAAWVWVGLNAGYTCISVHFMFTRILIKEKWRWYLQDIFAPLIAAVAAIGAIKVLWPSPESTVEKIILLGLASTLGILVSGTASSHIRKHIQSSLKACAGTPLKKQAAK